MAKDKWKLALSHCALLLLGLGLGSQIPSLIRHFELKRDLAMFEKQLLDEPARPEHWVSLGVTKSQAGDDAGAIAAYDKALELDPLHVNAYISMGTIHHGRDAFEEAERWYIKALQAARMQNDEWDIVTANQFLKAARADKERGSSRMP